MNAVELVKMWNSTNNTRYQVSQSGSDSAIVRAMAKLFDKGTEDEVTEYFIDKSKQNVDLWNATRESEFLVWKKERKNNEVKVEKEQELNVLGLLGKEIVSLMGTELANKIDAQVKENIDKYIQDKVLIKCVERNGEIRKVDGVVHSKFQEILNWINLDEPVLLKGPAGTGKNELLEQVAKALGLRFACMNAVKDEYKITGYGDANGEYVKTTFYDFFVNGGLFGLDEVDASNPEVLVILNCAIANRYFDFPVIGRVNAHPDFRVVACANTFGMGADVEYVGRNQLDAATLNRFAVVNVGYDAKIEESVCPDKDILQFAREFRKACDKNGYKKIISYRDMKRLYKAIVLAKMNVIDAIEGAITCSIEKDSLSGVISSMPENVVYKKYLREIYNNREY